jgi:hypothetical protein
LPRMANFLNSSSMNILRFNQFGAGPCASKQALSAWSRFRRD